MATPTDPRLRALPPGSKFVIRGFDQGVRLGSYVAARGEVLGPGGPRGGVWCAVTERVDGQLRTNRTELSGWVRVSLARNPRGA